MLQYPTVNIDLRKIRISYRKTKNCIRSNCLSAIRHTTSIQQGKRHSARHVEHFDCADKHFVASLGPVKCAGLAKRPWQEKQQSKKKGVRTVSNKGGRNVQKGANNGQHVKHIEVPDKAF